MVFESSFHMPGKLFQMEIASPKHDQNHSRQALRARVLKTIIPSIKGREWGAMTSSLHPYSIGTGSLLYFGRWDRFAPTWDAYWSIWLPGFDHQGCGGGSLVTTDPTGAGMSNQHQRAPFTVTDAVGMRTRVIRDIRNRKCPDEMTMSASFCSKKDWRVLG